MDRPCHPVNLPGAAQAGMARWRAAALALGLVLALPGCSVFDAPVVQRGNRVTEDQLKEITPGVQTRQDVQTLLGSPTQTSTFGDPTWYYISSKTRQRPGRQLLVTDQQTVVVTFDPSGVVREVKVLGEEDGKPVNMVSRVTPTPGNDRSLLQALFGNVGRIGPGASIPTSPGAPGAGTGR
jgi:outer membrane protein assembly factor BamE (lipoprotein component of BamABCDE complex)